MKIGVETRWDTTPPEPSTPSAARSWRNGLAVRRVFRPSERSLERVGRYGVVAQIAGGGMGSVLLGLMRGPAEFSRLVAIKCLHTRWLDDPKYVARFKTEVKLAAHIRHPNVVQALDVVEQDGELFLVMEYVDGVTLGALLGDLNRCGMSLPIGVSVGILASVLRGLHAAHEATDEAGRRLNIVHRDVSPQNIMITRGGFVQVLDFGAAKAVEHSQHTAAGVFVGKMAYMAPEQVLGEGSSPRTDVFAAGVVLWEALTGQRLFYDPSLARGELLHALVLKPVARPSELRPDVPEALDLVVARALERDPERRFQSALSLCEALEQAVPAVTGGPLGELVGEVCASRLAEREAQVRAGLEAAGSEPSQASRGEPLARLAPQISALVAPRQVQSSSRSRLAWLGLALLAASGLGWFMRPMAARAPAPALQAASSQRASLLPEQGDPAQPREQQPLTRTEEPADLAEAEAQGRPGGTPAPERSRRLRQPRPLRQEPSPRSSLATRCDPPTYMDSEGIRHFKKHCL